MNQENKTFEEIMHNITNLTSDNYEETVKDMVNYPNDEERKQLYEAFIKEVKSKMIDPSNYENEELLEENIENIRDVLIEFDPSISDVFVANNFDLDSIKAEINEAKSSEEYIEEENKESTEKATEEEIEEEREIKKIEERITELENNYINIYKKEMLLFKINENLNEAEKELITEIENNADEENEAIREINAQQIISIEENISNLRKELNNIKNNYEQLSSEEVLTIIAKNGIGIHELEENIRNSIENGEVLNYEAYCLKQERDKIEEELMNTLHKVDQKLYEKSEKDTPSASSIFENISDEQLSDELEILKEEKNQNWAAEDETVSHKLNTEHSNESAIDIFTKVEETTDKIAIIENVLNIRKIDSKIKEAINKTKLGLTELNNLKITRNAYYEIIDDSELNLRSNNKEKSMDENINEYLNNHHRINKINSYENSDKLRQELFDEIKEKQQIEQLFIERAEKNKKLWLKALAATAGFASGLAMSCVPGVGTIRMGISAAKLAGSAINIWTKKHPNGKIAKVKNNVNDKLNTKFPRIMATANKMREKLKQTPLNCFVNGVAAGYITGNIIESLTGETVFGNIKNMFDSEPNVGEIEIPEPNLPTEEPIVTPEPTPDVEIDVPEQTPIVNEPSINEPITPEPLPGIEDVPSINEDIIESFIPKEGEVYDLSSLAEGLTSSDATSSVDLYQSLGKEVVFDKAVQLPDGKIMWHFKQLNGAGYAWFDSADVQELMSKTSDVVTKTL